MSDRIFMMRCLRSRAVSTFDRNPAGKCRTAAVRSLDIAQIPAVDTHIRLFSAR
jgi:hypothetical protein